jgi:hypothetical protein
MERWARPSPGRWLLYAFGAGLPARHASWVLHDVTTRTWVVRHVVRSVVQIAPFALVLYLLIPGPATVRTAAVAMGALLGLFYSLVFIDASTEHRAIKAGYSEGTAAATRQERARHQRGHAGERRWR